MEMLVKLHSINNLQIRQNILFILQIISGPADSFLSWPAWVPLSKLTYCIYLTHYAILLYRSGIARTSTNLTKFEALHAFIGNLGFAMIVSVILCLSFEMPFTTLSQLAFGRQRQNLVPKQSSESIASTAITVNEQSINTMANVSSDGSLVSVCTIDNVYKNKFKESTYIP